MKISIHNHCAEPTSYRAARVKSLFNAESGADFFLEADLPFEGRDWKIGLVVGPSGSGKTSIGRKIFGGAGVENLHAGWPKDAPIIDAIAPGGSFDAATAALSAVGLGSVPAWLRPFRCLSNGEQFRAGLARLVCRAPQRAVVDEWTSVIDRQIARIGSLAFAKAWRRTGGQAVLLSCHRDVIPWLKPDWVFDTATGKFSGRCLRRRPEISFDIWETNWHYWPLFEPHHYLKLPQMMAATCYVAAVEGEPVCHLAVSPFFQNNQNTVRACRLVVMPEWQGVGIGTRFLNFIAARNAAGENRWNRRAATLFYTSHPGLCAALRRDPKWFQTSARLYGDNKQKSQLSISRAQNEHRHSGSFSTGYGGHFRAVQGFKFLCATCE